MPVELQESRKRKSGTDEATGSEGYGDHQGSHGYLTILRLRLSICHGRWQGEVWDVDGTGFWICWDCVTSTASVIRGW
jgi:hypothetical protein